MKVILYMAVSADGFIATKTDDTSWVSDTDWENFKKLIESTGVIVVGKRTYDVGIADGTFPYAKALHIVMTHDKELIKQSLSTIIFTDKDPRQIIKLAQLHHKDSLLVAGGGHTNGAFLKAGLINEIILSVHPIILGDGIKLFEGITLTKSLKLLDVKNLPENLIQLHFQVSNN